MKCKTVWQIYDVDYQQTQQTHTNIHIQNNKRYSLEELKRNVHTNKSTAKTNMKSGTS